MLRKELRLSPINDVRLGVGRFIFDISVSEERLREDYLCEVARRRLDIPAASELINKAFKLNNSPNLPDRIGELASVDHFIVAPLKRSRLKLNIYWPMIQRKILADVEKRYSNTKLCSAEQIACLIKAQLDETWRHEREHFIQAITLLPEHFERFDKLDKDNEIDRVRAEWLVRSCLAIGVLLIGRTIVGQYNFDSMFQALGWASLVSFSGGFMLKRIIGYLHYRQSPIEKAAWKQGRDGRCFNNIFEVTYVENAELDYEPSQKR